MKKPPDLVAQARARFYRQFPELGPRKAQPAPEEGRLVLGRDNSGAPFTLDSRLLSAHIDMVGGTGGGKSTAMRHFAWLQMESDASLNRATIIIDPHGQHEDSLFRTTLRRIVETGLHTRKKVFVIDPNSEFCTGLALLTGEAEPAVMADHMIEGFERLQGDENLFEKPTLRRALHGLLALLAERGWSLAEADLFLDPQEGSVREWALDTIQDRYARKALMRLHRLASDPRLHKEFEIETIGTENRLAPLLSSRAVRAIVGSQMLDMRDVLDQGAVLLVNTAGHNASSETAGDLLGKLVMRAILFAAKRRTINRLALVFADECARYVSQDWERALAELRKYRVGICSAHQTYAMLGKADDLVRQAIEQIPATKIAFRLNSMEEAATIAPELVKLNLEVPVKVLVKETVVGHRRERLRNSSCGTNTADTRSRATTQSEGRGTSSSHGGNVDESWTRTDSRDTSYQSSVGRSRAVGQSDQESVSEGHTRQRGSSRAHGGSRSTQTGVNEGNSFGQSFDVPVDPWRSGEGADGRAAAYGVADARSVTAGYDNSQNRSSTISEDWSETENNSEADTHQRSHARTYSDITTDSESEAFGVSEGSSDAYSTSRGRNWSASQSHERSTASTVGDSATRGDSRTAGWSDAFVPVLKKRPSAVHSLENVKHMAAEMLCSLPTGVAVVRTIQHGSIEGAIVRIPYRACEPVTDEQYAADLRLVMEGNIGIPMADAMRAIGERERRIMEVARAETLPRVEPEDAKGFRVPVRKPSSSRGDHND
jgi:hypothetical protein